MLPTRLCLALHHRTRKASVTPAPARSGYSRDSAIARAAQCSSTDLRARIIQRTNENLYSRLLVCGDFRRQRSSPSRDISDHVEVSLSPDAYKDVAVSQLPTASWSRARKKV